ncbi:hypothetical protein M885DRAFT_242614 [Pelagophyceae sp. CCMP2097]|nr:hypothetical protein M885DRAFT_242614 [Pelagophyceae sp. CCMP2097]
MSVEGVKALCSLLKKHAPKLKSLHLRGNRRLCDAGAVALARKYLAFPAARLNLRLVDVGDCGVGDCGAIAMADALRGKDEEALDLDLSNNLLTSVGVARLCRVAKILDARGADCDDAGRIAAALKASPALRALGLARCGLDPAAAAAIVGVLARRAPLLEALDLSGNALTPREHALKTKPAHKGVQVLFALRAAAKRFADDSGPLMQAETTCALVSLADELRGETAFAKLEWLGLANVGAERDHSKILKRAASKRPTLHVDLGANPAILRPQFAEPSL